MEFIDSLGCASKGHRPDFDSHGFWLYDDSERAVIHISTVVTAGLEASPPGGAAGVVDHIAFRVTESEESLKARLIDLKINFTQRINKLAGVTQVLVQAPEGLIIELQVPIIA